jgi:DNA gyrase/topoisomerase IV subunit A
MWIWWCFRGLSFALLLGALVFYFTQTDKFVSNQSQVIELKDAVENLEKSFAEQKLAGDSNVSDLRKLISVKRREKESFVERGEVDKEQLSFLEPKLIKMANELKNQQELTDAEKTKLAKLSESVEALGQEVAPLEERKTELLSILSLEKEKMEKVRDEWEIIDGNFSLLKKMRETAAETYTVSFRSIEDTIIRPQYLFYGDEIEVEIESVSPNKQEFYTKHGVSEGIEAGFVFIVKSDADWTEIPFYVTCTLARENYSIFQINQDNPLGASNSVSPMQSLKLIRSGEFSNRNEDEIPLDI